MRLACVYLIHKALSALFDPPMQKYLLVLVILVADQMALALYGRQLGVIRHLKSSNLWSHVHQNRAMVAMGAKCTKLHMSTIQESDHKRGLADGKSLDVNLMASERGDKKF